MKTTMRENMKLASMALTIFALGAASVYSQGTTKMSFSGTSVNSTVDLQQPDSTNAEYDLTGTGSLGAFTLRLVNAEPNSPSSSSTCSGPNKQYVQLSPGGGGVFRFQDGSLLYVYLTGGSDCIDFQAGHALCIRLLHITGGTGRFTNASGDLTLTETVLPVLFDALNNPVFFAATGEITGQVSGVSNNQGQQ